MIFSGFPTRVELQLLVHVITHLYKGIGEEISW